LKNMGHTIQIYGGRSEIFGDEALYVVTRLAVQAMDRHPERYGSLVTMREHWRTAPETSGNGCMDLRLEEFLSDYSAKGEFLILMGEVASDLRNLGDPIPATVLNAHFPRRIIWFTGDPDSAYFLDAVARLKNLIQRAL
jgi:hypothetical protein